MLDIKAFHPSQSTDSLVCEALRQEILWVCCTRARQDFAEWSSTTSYSWFTYWGVCRSCIALMVALRLPLPRVFPNDGKTPTTSRVWEIMKDMDDHSNPFKQIYVMYLISTVLSPTTRNHVSNMCYPIMVSSFPYCIHVL
jgi:hypothetical protein